MNLRRSAGTGWMPVGLICCATTALAVEPLPLIQPPATPPHHPSRILIRFKPQAVAAGPRDLTPQVPGARVIRAFDAVPGLTVVDVPPGKVEAAIKAVAARPDVLYAEPDYRVEMFATPNDPLFAELWGLQNTGQIVNADPGTAGADIRGDRAWDLWTGDPDFRIAVIDTGVNYTHPDLIGNMWTNPGEIPANGIDDDGNGYVDDVHGYNFLTDSSDPRDENGHGSHIAGTIGAVANNARGVTGINWQCQIVALRFGDAGGGGFTSDAIEALQYVIDNDIRVSNNSWGCYRCFQQALRDAIEATQAVGHLFVAASGNGIFGLGVDIDFVPAYPAGYDLPNIISVAATDNDDQKAKFSNFGPVSVDIGAPGVNILSTVLGSDYAYNRGTSMATPHVVGVVALLMSRRPELSWEQIRDRVLGTARPVDALRGITVSGGVVDALSAVGDCNENGVFDEIDILDATSLDCNLNGIPDECEPDCNENQTADECDISLGASADCDGNGVPDECQPDCNNNQVADICDIDEFVSADCNENGIPDECEVGFDQDCNTNGTPDLCDFFLETSTDCNGNDIPDECDIAQGRSEDCAENGLPDECERDCNENGLADSCDIMNGTSQDVDGDAVPDECAVGMTLVPIGASRTPVIDGQEIRIVEGGDTITFEIRLSGWDTDQDGVPLLKFYQAGLDPAGFTSGERGALSLAQIPCVTNDDCLGEAECTSAGLCQPEASIIVDESHPDFVYAGKPTISLTDVSRFRLGSVVFLSEDAARDTGESVYGGTVFLDVSKDAVGTFTIGFSPENSFFGDDAEPANTAPPPSLVPARVVIAPDCNRNGAPDELDLETGVSLDCDNDGIPDECVTSDRDCNENLIPDECDTRDGNSIDCNDNGIPDECIHLENDCNNNLIPDRCDIETGTSIDCNANGIPDECLALENDCNGNRIPDACDIADGVVNDCDESGIPDVCEDDCNGNGLEDACDIADGRSTDRDDNDVPDECQKTHRVPEDFPTIQQAIDAADRGDIIQLRPDTYRGTGNTNIDFRGKSVILRGSGAALTILDCTGVSTGVNFLGAENHNARLEDLTVSGAFSTGILCFGGTPVIRRCAITDCGRIGAGILLEDGAAPRIEDCVIARNMAGFSGGGIRAIRSHPQIIRCLFMDNSAAEWGGGVYGFLSDLHIEDCLFTGNQGGSGGGAIALVNGAATITRTIFSGNLAGATSFGTLGDGGAIHVLRTQAMFSSCLITGNEARNNGGGVYAKDGDPIFTNLTIVGNLAGAQGGGFFQDGSGNATGACCYIGECGNNFTREGCDAVAGQWYPGLGCSQIQCGTRSCCLPDGACRNLTQLDCALAGGTPNEEGSQCATRGCTPTIRNTIIWNNRAFGAATIASRIPFLTVADSIVQSGWPGDGNLDGPPRFRDNGAWLPGNVWQEGDYRLQSDAPGVDTGGAAWLPPMESRDLDGHPRVLCNAVDRGAYESGIGDYDCNGIVDPTDFSHWSACFTGMATAGYAAGCEAFDFDADGDVDLRDFAAFQNILHSQPPSNP